MNEQAMKHDLRRSVRVPVSGTARVLWPRGAVCRYTLDNLSLGGARILGHPSTHVGEPVRAIVELVGAASMTTNARVVREPTPGAPLPDFAIEFEHLSPAVADMLHVLWRISLENQRQPTVLVVARSASMRKVLSSQLAENGWRVITACTPIEAMDRLLLDEIDLRWIVVLDRLTQTSGLEFLAFVGDAYPSVRRLLISRPDSYRAALSAVDHGVANAAALQPISKTRLDRIIGHC